MSAAAPSSREPVEPYPLPAAARAVIAGAERYLAGLPAVAAADGRLVAAELDEHLRSAESGMPAYPRDTAAALRRFAERIAAEDVRALLPAGAIERFTARAVRATQRLAEQLRADALGRALPLLGELEGRVAGDPFAGLDRAAMTRAAGELARLRQRIVSALAPVPAADPEVIAAQERLRTADLRLDAARAAWGKASVVRRVPAGWAAIAADIAGWESEADAPPAGLLTAPAMPRTRMAVQRIRGGAVTDAAAAAVFAAAAAALAGAFGRALDEAERIPTPRGPYLDLPTRFAADAEAALAGTPHLALVLARARALDARWQAEVSAGRSDTGYAALSRRAARAWPAIVAATGARADLDPADPGSVGRAVLLSGVYNRAGWDFADCDFAMRHPGGAVLAGYYEPYVLRALDNAWHEAGLDVSDRVPWNVVGVVEGRGAIGEHTVVTLLDRDTGGQLGTLTEWRPAGCVRLRVIALHAGPLTAAPGQE